MDESLTRGRQEQERKLQSVTEQLDKRLNVFGELKEHLGQLEAAQKKIGEVGLQVNELTKILQAPKARGGFGEALLNDFLAQHLPKEHYEIQYKFPDGHIVDAIIKLAGGLVPIDSKFPLENFRKLIGSKEGEDIEKGAKRRFRNDVKKHVDDIASKYIRPADGTLEFAFMYIPAENVYYEIITSEFESDLSLNDYAIGKRVIPVSPNNFFAYLMTVAMGLRGMQLEERTKEVLAKLSQMNSQLGSVISDFQTLGSHLTNAAGKYRDTNEGLNKFDSNLRRLTEVSDEDIKAIGDDSE